MLSYRSAETDDQILRENSTLQEEPGRDIPPLLLAYWQIALRWKWLIAAIITASVIAGLILSLLMTPQYRATARMEVSREQKNVTNVQGLEGADAGQNLEFYNTQWSLLEARSLAERVARELRLADKPEFFTAHGETPEGDDETAGAGSPMKSTTLRHKREAQAVDLLLDHIAISPIRGSALVDVGYVSASPHLSAQVANSWTQQFILQSMDRRFSSTSDARTFLEGRLAELRARLENSEREAVNFAAEKGIVQISRSSDNGASGGGDVTLASMDLTLLNTELAKATAQRVAAESRLNAAGGTATAESLGSQALASMRTKRAEAAADYAKILVQFDPEYPAAVALKRQMDALDQSISREESRISGTRSGEYREAVQRESQLRERVESLKGRLVNQERNGIQYQIYMREADTNRQLYEALLQRYKEIGVAGVSANNIAIIDTAKPSTIPSSPNLPLNLALALIAGIGLACLATLVLNQIDEGLRNPADVNRALQLPLLGSVPDVEDGSAIDLLRDPKTALSEAYFSIQSNIAFSTDHGVPRSLMITSTRPAEGKSTTSFALATILARSGRRVLLIDADMRSPSLAGFVGLSNEHGLSNYLAGEDGWQKLVHDNGAGIPAYMVAGPTPPSAAELLSSDRLSNLMGTLGQHFDHIVIDSPPILGLADAPLLSRAVEGVVFVVEADGVPVRGIRSALARLRAAQSRIFGVVLTKLQQRHAGYGYGYGYGYNYGQDEDETKPVA